MLLFRVCWWDCLRIALGGCEVVVGTAVDGVCVPVGLIISMYRLESRHL